MNSRYEGGLGTREGGDLVRWSLEIEDFVRQERIMYDLPVTLVEKAPEATLTLHAISREESVAVIALINQMRSAATGTVILPSKFPSIGDRFGGLELPDE